MLTRLPGDERERPESDGGEGGVQVMRQGEPALVVDQVDDGDVKLGLPQSREERLVPQEGVAVGVDHRPRLQAQVPEHSQLKYITDR